MTTLPRPRTDLDRGLNSTDPAGQGRRERPASSGAVLPDGNGGFLPCPELLTEEEAIRYLRLDLGGPAKPGLTLRYYREKGLLRATRVGRRLRYRRVELDRLLEQLTDRIGDSARSLET